MMSDQRHRVQADHSERDAPLLELLRQADDFDVRMARLTVGDYLINDEVLIERKTLADFAASLVDGRLFPQAARLARDDHRSLMLIEGPPATSMPDVHPHAIQGALVSWRRCGACPCFIRSPRMIRCASSVFWQRKSMVVANACFADTRGSRSGLRLGGRFCFKVYPAWVRRWPHAC
jgi:DNA excision repair protein ERCC-4